MFGYEKRFQSDTETVMTMYCKTMVDGMCADYVSEQKNATLPCSLHLHLHVHVQYQLAAIVELLTIRA